MYQVIGFRRKSFTFKEDNNKTVSGYELHLIEERKGIEGRAAENLFVSDNKLDGYSPVLNDLIEIVWNRWGKVDAIKRVAAK